MLEDAEQQPKEGKPGASKSRGKQLGDQPAQAAEGAEAPPEETLPDPDPTKPHTQLPETHSQAQARLPPKTPPRLLPKTLTKMNPQLLLSMSWSTKQQAKLG